jgi:hypothetical protein
MFSPRNRSISFKSLTNACICDFRASSSRARKIDDGCTVVTTFGANLDGILASGLKRQLHFFELLLGFLRGLQVFLRGRKRLVA